MILINGNFLCRNLTGIERYAWEVLRRLDALVQPGDDIRILVPANARAHPDFVHIHPVISEKEIRGFPFWDLGTFARACARLGATGLNFANTAPLGKRCGIAFLHDIYAKDCPADFTGFRDTLVKWYCRLNYRNIAQNARKIITVSEFSRERIMAAYGTDAAKIAVIPNGWEHFAETEADGRIFARFPALSQAPFYFTLGSLSRRKNLAWIARYAAAHPADTLAVSGKAISGLVPPELETLKELPNVVLLGYVTDGEVKALMQQCRAFVFPSYYEGFGIPPLEALSVGAPVAVARAASLPEIYGGAAHYIDISRTDQSLADVLAAPAEPPDAVLARYTYQHAAEQLAAVLREFA